MNSCGERASQRTRLMGISPGQMLSRIWHATAPEAVSSIFDRFSRKLELSQSMMARRPTKKAGSIMPIPTPAILDLRGGE